MPPPKQQMLLSVLCEKCNQDRFHVVYKETSDGDQTLIITCANCLSINGTIVKTEFTRLKKSP